MLQPTFNWKHNKHIHHYWPQWACWPLQRSSWCLHLCTPQLQTECVGLCRPTGAAFPLGNSFWCWFDFPHQRWTLSEDHCSAWKRERQRVSYWLTCLCGLDTVVVMFIITSLCRTRVKLNLKYRFSENTFLVNSTYHLRWFGLNFTASSTAKHHKAWTGSTQSCH